MNILILSPDAHLQGLISKCLTKYLKMETGSLKGCLSSTALENDKLYSSRAIPIHTSSGTVMSSCFSTSLSTLDFTHLNIFANVMGLK